jgi:4,5-dihydroxyphthalate decarboxylase
VLYMTGGEEEPNRPEKLKLDLPANIRVERIGPDKTLAQMLLDGEIDALHTARAPSSFYDGSGRVVRLFENYPAVELEYYRRTGIFPIMHCVVIRREVYEQNRWVAQSLFKAFKEAQQKTYQDMHETAAHKTMLPWLSAHVEEARREMGNDFWSYGFTQNRETIANFLRYHHEQGLSKRLLTPEDLFAPEALEAFVI